MPFRTYQRYEQDESYGNDLKRKAIIDALNKEYEINEEKGLLSIDIIKKKVTEVLKNIRTIFCFVIYLVVMRKDMQKKTVI